MATSSTSNSSSIPGFNGTSTFATDLQNVITRAVDIASPCRLPNWRVSRPPSRISNRNCRQWETILLTCKLPSAQWIQRGRPPVLLRPTVDNTAVASAALSAGALAGTYSVAITNLGSRTNTISNSTLPTVSDPTVGNISTSSAFTMTVNGTAYNLKPSATNLNALVSAINNSGAPVQATIVNVGGSTAPSYQLSIQGTQYAPTTIQLSDGSKQ